MVISPALHSLFLSFATLGALLFAGVILARNPQSTAARMHAVYGALAAGWLFCMAMVASADTHSEVQFWSRMLQLSLGMLPGVIFHLNVVTAGVAHQFHPQIQWHYGLSVVVTVVSLANPVLLSTPYVYSWGLYPNFTLWGLLPLCFLLVTFVEVVLLYRRMLSQENLGGVYRQKIQAFCHGNMFATLALVDFIPAFGFAVYPFGFVIMSVMHFATLFGSIRYRLIDLTPEFTAPQILQNIPDGVFVIDSQGVVRFINKACAKMFGQNQESCLNQYLLDIAPVQMAEYYAREAMPIGQELSFESTTPEQLFTVVVSTTELHDQAQGVIGAVWVLRDLTEQRRVEAEKNELEDWVRSGQKLETLGVMAGGIAHDFNNILVAILGSAELAKSDVSSTSDMTAYLETIVHSAERAVELTRQMLTYAGQNTPANRLVDVNALCREINELSHSAVSKKATFTTEFVQALPLVMADSGQLSQVILNLITNASDALGDEVGSVTLRTDALEMETSEGGDVALFVIIEVADSGCGMDAETKERIFDPFYTTKFTGRGLGLANVMSIVQSHSGRIKVESEPGCGSTFTIALPATEASTLELVGQQVEQEGHNGGLALLVDDEPEVRRVAANMLERIGFDTIQASHGKEAIAILQQHQDNISLILLDITMPEMDGIETHLAIRSLSSELPVVLMSGYQSNVSAPLLEDLNTTFLMKPFRFQQLTEKINEVTTQANLRATVSSNATK